MPHPMIHLAVAKHILDNHPEIKKPEQFYLGSLAPDAVHFREGFHRQMKKTSHLCVGDQPWGKNTNVGEWADSALSYLAEHRDSQHIDLIRGYVAHTLLDNRWTTLWWTPFRLAHEAEIEAGTSTLHTECYEIDFQVYKAFPHTKAIMDQLIKSAGVDLPLVSAIEMERIRDHILYTQYCDRDDKDMDYNVITLEDMWGFIASESKTVSRWLHGV